MLACCKYVHRAPLKGLNVGEVEDRIRKRKFTELNGHNYGLEIVRYIILI